MSLHVGIGFSKHPDILSAAQEVAKRARAQLGFERIDAAILFNTPHYNPKDFLPLVSRGLSQTRIIGCQTAEIIIENRYEPVGIGVLLITSDHIRFTSNQVTHLAIQDLGAAGLTFIRGFATESGLAKRKNLLFFFDGQMKSIEQFIGGIKENSGKILPLIGAGSTALLKSQKTYQYHLDHILSEGACGLLLGETFSLAMACEHGWKPLGRPRKITAAQDNIIQTIDDKKAIEIYKELFGDLLFSKSPDHFEEITQRYPLGIRNDGSGEFLLRNVSPKLDAGSIVCQDTVTVDATVHIMMGNKRSCLQAAEQAAYQAREQLAGTPPRLILVMQSITRRALLGRSAIQEINIIRNVLGDKTPLIGMCSQKEIFSTMSPERITETKIHNNSLMILAIG